MNTNKWTKPIMWIARAAVCIFVLKCTNDLKCLNIMWLPGVVTLLCE